MRFPNRLKTLRQKNNWLIKIILAKMATERKNQIKRMLRIPEIDNREGGIWSKIWLIQKDKL